MQPGELPGDGPIYVSLLEKHRPLSQIVALQSSVLQISAHSSIVFADLGSAAGSIKQSSQRYLILFPDGSVTRSSPLGQILLYSASLVLESTEVVNGSSSRRGVPNILK